MTMENVLGDTHKILHDSIVKRVDILEEDCREHTKLLTEQGKDLVRLVERMDTQTKTLNALTKALWGLIAALIITFVGFMLDKIPL